MSKFLVDVDQDTWVGSLVGAGKTNARRIGGATASYGELVTGKVELWCRVSVRGLAVGEGSSPERRHYHWPSARQLLPHVVDNHPEPVLTESSRRAFRSEH